MLTSSFAQTVYQSGWTARICISPCLAHAANAGARHLPRPQKQVALKRVVGATARAAVVARGRPHSQEQPSAEGFGLMAVVYRPS